MKFLIFTILIIALAQSKYTYENENQCDTYLLPEPMTVQGNASAKLNPDLVNISFSVETMDFNASKSLSQNSEIIQKAISEIKQSKGVQDNEITTTGLQIYPQYDSKYNKSTQEYTQQFKGYKVINSINIRTKAIDQAGSIIDSAVRNGVHRVDSVTFDTQNTTKKEVKDKLIAEAVADSEFRAKLALDALNYEIVGIKNVQINGSAPLNEQPMYNKAQMFMADSAEESYDTQIFSDNISVSASVSVSFLIAPKMTQ